MSRFSKSVLVLALGFATLGASTAAFAFDNFKGVGRQATPAEVKAWDIDVRPDFKGLPLVLGDIALRPELRIDCWRLGIQVRLILGH